jgi:HEAT repeat protein
MKGFHIALLIAVATVASAPRASALPTVTALPFQQQADPADSLYRRARRLLDDGKHSEAASLFRDLGARYPRSVHAASALYWQAFAFYRAGSLNAAVTALESQAAQYPNAPTREDAAALYIQLKGELAKRGDTTARREVDSAASSSRGPCDDMEVRIAALDALQQMDSDRVLPILRRILARRDECSLPLRKNAIFILAQKGGAERDKLLLEIAKQDGDVAVRKDAVFHLGQARSPEAVDALEDILLNGNDDAVRGDALFALAQRGTDRTRKILTDFALGDGGPTKLRRDALFHIAQQASPETNRWLASVIASTRAPMPLRKDAVFHLAQQRAGSGPDISTVYDEALPVDLKKDLIFHIAHRRDERSIMKLISIAKTDPSPQLRKDALFHLGQSKDPRALKALEDMVIP